MLKCLAVTVFAIPLFITPLLVCAVEPKVEMFAPEGTAKEVRQVTVRFSEQMVAFGDPRSKDPFEVSCAEKGQGRWVDERTWSYDFEKNLSAGVACRFTIKQDVRTLSGQAIEGQRDFSFNTGGPSVIETEPSKDQQFVQQDQAFVMTLDAEADEASVTRHVYCSIQGIKERVGIRLLQGAERRDILKALYYDEKKEPMLVVQCRQTFPPGAEVKIIWGKGVLSRSGIATTEEQVLTFKARGPFEAKLRCLRERPKTNCIALAPIQLVFSAPVPLETAKRITLKSDRGRIWRPRPVNDDAKDYADSVIFQGPFPESTPLTITVPREMKDDSGRMLSNSKAFPMRLKTDAYPPLAKFAADFGILEFTKDGAALPLTVRNIEAQIKAFLASPAPLLQPSETSGGEISEQLPGAVRQVRAERDEGIIGLLNAVKLAEREKSILKDRSIAKRLTIPKSGGTKEFEVIGIPFKDPGFYVVEVESPVLGAHLLEKKGPMYVPAAALVTNMAAHFKKGPQSSLVWITSLDKGQPVGEASVTIRTCAGRSVWQGKTDENGIARIPAALPTDERCEAMQSEYREGLFVFARKGNDMTFTHTSWREGIEPWRFNLFRGHHSRTEVLAHTVFDRTLLKAGEVLNMKHILREGSINGIIVPRHRMDTFNDVFIEHLGSQQEYHLPVDWRTNGIAESTWKVPAGAKLGTYNVYLTSRTADKKHADPRQVLLGSFRVEEFRVPLAKGVIQGPKEPLIGATGLEVDVGVKYLAGGTAALLPVKVRSESQWKFVRVPDHEEFTFANGRIKEGPTEPTQYAEDQEGEEASGETSETREGTATKEKPRTIELKLDENGAARAKIQGIKKSDTPRDMMVELEFKDPNGEVQTSTTRIPIYPSRVLTGINVDDGAHSINAPLSYHIAVVDLRGKPVAGAEVRVDLLQRKDYSHRRRVAGGFYAYETAGEIKRSGTICTGKTDEKGILACSAKPTEGGNIILQAEAKDASGNVSVAHSEIWIAGDDRWFEGRNDDRMDLLPEKKEYQTGETARLQVKMPFQEATALVTVEREGVIDAYVRKISRKDPFVGFPIKSNYSPNVFVSVLVVRGRVGGTKPTALFDPGKPSYRLGITELKVGWRPHELKVKVLPAKEAYKTRDQVDVLLQIRTATGKELPKGTEAAVAVIDEGLLELKPNESWKLLDSMMRKRLYEVGTSTAQMMVVGKRHFGKKALPHGGGGGRMTTREFFEAAVFWKARVPVDENGQGKISFKLNDSLTSFRIVAVATSGPDLFGTGDASIRSTQDLMMLSGLPPLVREGDTLRAGFTVRNASGRAMNVEAAVVLSMGKERKELRPVRQHLEPGEAREITWDVSVPAGENSITYQASARELDGGDGSDRLIVSQKVVKAVPVKVYQAVLNQVKEPVVVQAERPADAIANEGGIQVLMKPKIAEGLAGVTRYMRDYPYICLEQKVSKAVALRDRKLWDGAVGDLPSYLDEDGLAKYFPSMRQGDDILTSYVLALSHEAGYPLPEHARHRMIQGLVNFVQGKVNRQYPLSMADLTIRRLAALEALSRFDAVPKGALDAIIIDPNLWPNATVLDWIRLLLRTPALSERDARLKQAKTVLRSRLNPQGAIMTLSERRDDAWWLMVSPDSNMVRTLLTSLELPDWQEDVPRLVRGALGRLQHGHWETTPANVWGMLAMEKFSAKFESEAVTGKSTATLGRKEDTVAWAKNPEGGAITFPWVKGRETLKVTHQGTGKPWATIQSLAAIPIKQAFSSGYAIKKKIVPVEQKTKGVWGVGDTIFVQLEINAQSDMTWVVVNDPIPAGSTILGGGLGRDSALLSSQTAMQRGSAREVYRERAFEGLRAYFEYVPKGTWTVEYIVRLNNAGTFIMPETRVEALYSPEMFGVLPNKAVHVKP